MSKQVIIMRTDLNMRKGKMIAQGAHASLKVIFDRMCTVIYESVSRHSPPEKREVKELELSTPTRYDPLKEWTEGNFITVVMGCDSLEELYRLQSLADSKGLPTALVKDDNFTEFRERCPECGGFGCHEAANSDEFFCKKCGGTGEINKPTITCMAIGPGHSEVIDQITEDLKLL